MNIKRPILYSFRRCPYAIRARMALAYASITVELREVVLKDKPAQMLVVSDKGTVPVLILNDGQVIDQSIDIMQWALMRNDRDQWLAGRDDELNAFNDGEFKHWLDRYKYADRYPEHSAEFYQRKADVFVKHLDGRLAQTRYLCGDQVGFSDVAIFPFVRQFAGVNKATFEASLFLHVRRWLNEWLESQLFRAVMAKYSKWEVGCAPVYVDWHDDKTL